ncbi:putative LRR receptor-like serine/threonine-protein kinase [Iris pallida]|uniref:LRR receptor-like serine/threonine-protein kinase n=1 Tax=Iris pallida TaxID=29817 RepID=A0AAX6DPL7_IRIPA|nr:putative LRR receptor-like serine/threonine-protein kinase [Iris pallida]
MSPGSTARYAAPLLPPSASCDSLPNPEVAAARSENLSSMSGLSNTTTGAVHFAPATHAGTSSAAFTPLSSSFHPLSLLLLLLLLTAHTKKPTIVISPMAMDAATTTANNLFTLLLPDLTQQLLFLCSFF